MILRPIEVDRNHTASTRSNERQSRAAAGADDRNGFSGESRDCLDFEERILPHLCKKEAIVPCTGHGTPRGRIVLDVSGLSGAPLYTRGDRFGLDVNRSWPIRMKEPMSDVFQ